MRRARLYFSHQHSQWYSLFNAFNDGWCPGEQYTSAVVGKPSFYMDEIPDRVWRTEFYSPTTGVATFLLAGNRSLGRRAASRPRAQRVVPGRGPGLRRAGLGRRHQPPCGRGGLGCPAGLRHERGGVRPVLAAGDASCSDAELRVSFWRKKAGPWLLAVTNFTDRERTAELRMQTPGEHVQFRPAWQAATLSASADSARLTVPAKRGVWCSWTDAQPSEKHVQP